jgi:sugar phosphate isomerase/epimerase
MNTNLTRRDFLKTTGLACAAGLVRPAAALAEAAPKKWPVGCRDVHLNAAAGPDSWTRLKALGGECTEVAVNLDLSCPNLSHPQHQYTLASAEGIGLLKGDLAASGCRISAFLMSNRFDERLEEELACAGKLVKAAQELGVEAIRIDLWPRRLSKEEFLPFAISTGKRLCALAAGTPVRFGVENHGEVTNDPAFLEQLWAGVGSDQLGLTLDLGNFYWWGHPLKDLYAIYERVAPRAIHTHCKSIRYPDDKKDSPRARGWGYAQYNCPIYEGDIDYKRAVGILRHAGYRGDLCVENEALGKFPADQRADVLRQEIALLKRLRDAD